MNIENQGIITESNKKSNFRVRFSTRRPYVQITTTKVTTFPIEDIKLDQELESSNQQSTEGGDTTDLGDVAVAFYELQQPKARNQTLRFTTVPTTTKKKSPPTTRIRVTTTALPLSTRRIILRNNKPQPFSKTTPLESYTRKPNQYDYYDDGVAKLISNLPEHSKVIIHSSGVIQCLDQGNFPHPVSCKKFISCAKMETGKVLGWEYTCPKNLSFDPIGGICNWSADLGCEE